MPIAIPEMTASWFRSQLTFGWMDMTLGYARPLEEASNLWEFQDHKSAGIAAEIRNYYSQFLRCPQEESRRVYYPSRYGRHQAAFEFCKSESCHGSVVMVPEVMFGLRALLYSCPPTVIRMPLSC